MHPPWHLAWTERPRMFVVDRQWNAEGEEIMRIYRCAKGHECPLAPLPWGGYAKDLPICEECEGR